MSIISAIGKLWHSYKKRKLWRAMNPHNDTCIEWKFTGSFNVSDVTCGARTYGALSVLSASGKKIRPKLKIGSFCSVGPDVIFILASEHNTSTISTFPFKVKVLGEKTEAGDKGNIVVDDDVWIGARATICSGVHIAQGAVIAAGAVVTKDVSPYAVVGGVPAKVIKYRFGEDMIAELLKVDYSKLTDDMIKEHIDDLYTPLTDAGQLGWMPKK